jgi:uncharacterized membrane protein YphA (DoxX/SURF4 family)
VLEPVGQIQVKWRPAHMAIFRFVCLYFMLYNLPHPPALWEPVAQWVGKSVLHLSYEVQLEFNGSGDTTYHYVIALCQLIFAVLAAFIWSVLDHRRSNYQQLERWLKVYLRLVLGHTMLTYGSSKIFEGQFPQPGPSRLVETFGESSPMGLLWTFMGASKPYTFFAGLAEMVPGLLLFLPPLAGLGALLCCLVILNIFMLNMCYDVPVKLYSFHLLLIALYLALPDLRRLTRIIVFNRAAEPLPVAPLFKRATVNDIALSGQVLLGIVLATWALWGASMREKHDYIESIANTPMYGVWQVDECAFAPSDVAAKGVLQIPWRSVVFEEPGYVVVHKHDGDTKYYLVNVDSIGHKIILSSTTDPRWQGVLSTAESSPEVVTLDGQGDGLPSHLKMHRIDTSKLRLKSRGFHWINESPYNR